MRDVFLTTLPPPLRWNLSETYASEFTLFDLKEILPNPFSVLYCSTFLNLCLNTFIGATIGLHFTHYFGLKKTIVISFLGGLFAGACFQIQSRIHPSKNSTPYDACSTSSGALSALSSSFVLHQVSQRHTYMRAVAISYILYKIIEEYVLARTYIDLCHEASSGRKLESQSSVMRDFQRRLTEQFYGPITDTTLEPQVREWGSFGGVFLGILWASLTFKPFQERKALMSFY
eukprot:CAMPEP_0201538220 /NCGR_PEP_ID=MMETSP0161_2-20130828/67003_1 /ASSEMBLY_ACC=CAM_ASM_000251 /TAXON_ID=180227 /ORGANISM="Neoparamoeba aestuarina, Strain SoJaBio B1-5/56/2" /LENGTH=230 /DNA_ID=CAMNT_0047944943 /DNA_START=165 /DNA_END=854 /DNA_ORIENTATION=-